MADDWDLFAVVRSCTNSTAIATAGAPPPPITTSSSISNPARVSRNRGDPFVNLLPPFQKDDVDPFYFPGVIVERDDYSFQGLEEICKELYLDSAVPGPSGEFQNSHHQQQQQVQPRVLQPPPPPPPPQQQNQHSPINRRGTLGSSFPSTNPHSAARPRRRKNQQAKVTHHMTQEELSTDSWAWRKYGQKPIKGSPYPRNYYRCSTSKSCSARKQVERSPTDPDIFVVSYSGEHTHPRPTHRSSLAGSTRSKLPTTKPPTNIAATLITTSSSSPVSATSFSPAATPIVMEEEEGDSEGNQENINRGDNDDNDNNNIEEDEEEEEEEEEEEDILIPNSFITDDILKGFEELNGGGGGNIVGVSDSVTDNSSACGLISPPWTPTTNFAAAGGGC